MVGADEAAEHLRAVREHHPDTAGASNYQRLADPADQHEGKQMTFADAQAAPVPLITSPEWSGSELGRRSSPFTTNTQRLRPWHTLTGRQHVFLDHDWVHEAGEALPIFRPPSEHAQAVRRATDVALAAAVFTAVTMSGLARQTD